MSKDFTRHFVCFRNFGNFWKVPSYCRTVIVQYVTVHLISCGNRLYANITVCTVLLLLSPTLQQFLAI